MGADRSLDHVARALDVDGMHVVCAVIGVAGCHVHDGLAVAHGALQRLAVPDVILERDHVGAAPLELGRDMAADESARAGEQDLHQAVGRRTCAPAPTGTCAGGPVGACADRKK